MLPFAMTRGQFEDECHGLLLTVQFAVEADFEGVSICNDKVSKHVADTGESCGYLDEAMRLAEGNGIAVNLATVHPHSQGKSEHPLQT